MDSVKVTKILCSIEGCKCNRRGALGLCNAHYKLLKKNGDPTRLRRARDGAHLEFVQSAIMSNTDECIDWPFPISQEKWSYPMFTYKGKIQKVSRFVLSDRLGRKLSYGEVARHRCDNPLCVNPRHLEPGTHQDNMDDMRLRGRVKAARGSKCHLSKLTEADVLNIRRLLSYGVLISDIARIYAVSSTAISGIKKGRTWKHVA